MWLIFILHLFIGTTLAGSAVIAMLVAGFGSMTGILVAALVGFVIALPVAWIVARKLDAAS